MPSIAAECETHAKLVALHPPAAAAESEAEIFGMSFPLDRMYHRGSYLGASRSRMAP